MPKRTRRITPTQDVFKRRCNQLLGDQAFRDAIDRVRRQFGITPEPFPRDVDPQTGRPDEMGWWRRTTIDVGKCLKALDKIRDQWFGSLSSEYHALWGAATVFVRRALCYENFPIPSQPDVPPVMMTRDLLMGPLLKLQREIKKELQRLGWQKKKRDAFWLRVTSQWLRTLADTDGTVHVAGTEEQWQQELERYGGPIIIIPSHVTSEQYRSWWPEVERVRDRAYGRPRFPRRLRAGDFGEEIDKLIATMWAAGKSESAITAAVARYPSVHENQDRYDRVAEYVRAVVRSLPKRHRKAKVRERLPGAASTGSRSLPRG